MLEENFNENGKNKFINSINSLKVNNNCCTYSRSWGEYIFQQLR